MNGLKFTRKEFLTAGAAVVFMILLIIVIGTNPSPHEMDNEATSRIHEVTLLSLNEMESGVGVVASGKVEAVNEADMISETAGRVRDVHVSIGQSFLKGDVLVSLDASDQLVQVEQARAALAIQEAQLSELLRNSEGSGSESSDLILVEAQQEINVQNAYKTLLNTDLQAYSLDDDNDKDAYIPTISGVYKSLEEGDYVIETYSSGADSGVSYRLTGLERGTFSAEMHSPQPLGLRGLQIQFPNTTSSNLSRQKWVISIPNDRSSSYVGVLNAYEAEKQTKEVILNKTTVSEERIQSQRAAVSQAVANLKAVQLRLSKASIRAPFSGVVLSVHTNVGEFANVGTPIASLVSDSGKEVHAFLASKNAINIGVGSKIFINDVVSGVVINKAPGIDPQTGKVEVVVVPDDTEDNLALGEFVTVTFLSDSAEDDVVKLPLKAVRMKSTGSEVFVIFDGVVASLEVETGEMYGSTIAVHSGLEGTTQIIANVRGLAVGDQVQI